MQNPVATLYCPNPRCQAPNPQSHNFCQNCRTPLLKIYLWAAGEVKYPLGELLADRYLLKGRRILLDTKPGQPPETRSEIPQELAPYLKLSPYRLHIPQVYGLLTLGQGRRTGEIWLLEKAPIYTGGMESAKSGQLMPEIVEVWKNASPLRQISWLWQIASLWQPLSTYGVASSLLSPTNLRVEGSLIRLLELQADRQTAPTLQHLGHLWSQWAGSAHPALRNFIEQLASGLVQGQVQTSEQLVALLDRGLAERGRSLHSTYQIFTLSDKGPSRRRNEDACYPPSGTAPTPTPGSPALAIVCDGIGGHEGGDVASSLAIEAIRTRVENLLAQQGYWNPTTLTLELEQAALTANDAIGQRNDSEHRQDRQRMGTTVVMALAQAHEIYITHVGDSRVYRITSIGCHQVTLDDDIASREVRLGYALYREAVQQPSSGSLVQALGMGSSSVLHPTVQRFVLDEDCIFLLCSDGLSDHDRVEQYWETEIVPVLQGQIDLAQAGQRLVELGNTQNGHDNVTVALVYCQVKHPMESSQTELPLAQIESVPPTTASLPQTIIKSAAPSQMKTQRLQQPSSSGSPWTIVLCFLLLGLLGGALVYFWPQIAFVIGQSPKSAPTPASSSPSPSPEAPPPSVSSVTPGSLIKIQSSTTNNSQGQTIPLLLRRGLEPPDNKLAFGIIAPGSVLQVITNKTSSDKESWLNLKVCYSPGLDSKTQQSELALTQSQASKEKIGQTPSVAKTKPDSVKYTQVQPGEVGWIREAEVVGVIDQNFPASSARPVTCSAPSVSPPSLPVSPPPQKGQG